MESALLPRRTVAVGDVELDTVVLGGGSPTVVFVNGLGSPLEEWALVAPVVAERHRVVLYERRHAPARGRIPNHGAALSAADLHLLLEALDVAGPFVLVGHSWGGAIIRRYAVEHPQNAAALVFVDASHERIKGMIPKRPALTKALYTSTTLGLRVGFVRRRLLRMLGFDRLAPAELTTACTLPWVASGRTSRAEYGGIGPSLRELAEIAPDLPSVPTRVLLAGGRGDLTAKLGAKQLAAVRSVWEDAVEGRPEVELQVVADAGHYISLDQPAAVIDAIDEVVGQVSPLKGG